MWVSQFIDLIYGILYFVCEGIVPVKSYVIAEHILSNDSLRVAGMQGQPQSLDDMTDGQIEDRFYQSVSTFISYLYVTCLQCFDAVVWAAGRASGLQKN